jgi:hypothetical protein
MSGGVQVTVRLPGYLLEELEKVEAMLGERPEFRAVGLNRSGVVRMALELGLAELRERHGKKKRRR